MNKIVQTCTLYNPMIGIAPNRSNFELSFYMTSLVCSLILSWQVAWWIWSFKFASLLVCLGNFGLFQLLALKELPFVFCRVAVYSTMLVMVVRWSWGKSGLAWPVGWHLTLTLIAQTVVIGDGLEHIEPDRTLLALEMSWLQLDVGVRENSERVDVSAWGRQVRSHSNSSSFLTLRLAKRLFEFARLLQLETIIEIVGLVRVDSRQELLQSVNFSLALNLTQALSLLFWDFDFQLRQTVRALHWSIENLLLCIHHVVIVKVDSLGSRLRIYQVLLKLALLQLILECDGLILVSGAVWT